MEFVLKQKTELYHISPVKGRKEGNVLFNEVNNTFYLQLYAVKNHSDRERKPADATWVTLSS